MTQPFTPAELDTIKAAAEAATKNATLARYDHGGGRLAVFEGDKRELVADLYNLDDREFFDLLRPETVLRLVEQIERLTKELTNADYLRGNQLAAITTALMSDTRISHINCQLPKGHALRTPAFDDAMRTIEKIFELRAALVEQVRPMEWKNEYPDQPGFWWEMTVFPGSEPVIQIWFQTQTNINKYKAIKAIDDYVFFCGPVLPPTYTYPEAK